jgi:hypothetical protein
MPPIRLSSQSRLAKLSSRVDGLFDTHQKYTLPLIAKLPNLKPDGAGHGTVADTTGEIHEALKREDEELEIMRQEFKELGGDSSGEDAQRLAVQLARLGEDFTM